MIAWVMIFIRWLAELRSGNPRVVRRGHFPVPTDVMGVSRLEARRFLGLFPRMGFQPVRCGLAVCATPPMRSP
jgi:hypothetical protein